MTNISKKKTDTKDFAIAQTQLVDLIAKLDKRTSQYLIHELLSTSDQVMIVKRFAAIFMFNNNYSPYRVSETLSISTSSARRLYLQFENNQFDNLLGCIKKKEKNSFLAFIEDLTMAQVSPRARARLMNRTLR